MVRIVFAFLLSPLLGTGAIAAGDRAAVFGATRVTADSHSGGVNTYGPPITWLGGPSSDIWQVRYLRPARPACAGRGKPFQLHVRAMFPKRVCRRQVCAGGRPLDTIVSDCERTGAGTPETVGVNLRQAKAEGYAGAGLQRIAGRRAVVDVPAAYVAAVATVVASRRVIGTMPIGRWRRSDARQGGIRRAARRWRWPG